MYNLFLNLGGILGGRPNYGGPNGQGPNGGGKELDYTVNNYRQVTGMVTGENFAFFIYRHFVEIL